jgi:prophage regulatory protein
VPTETPARILRLKVVLERTGLSRSTLYRKMRERTFPKALRISVRCCGWRESDVEAWLRNPESYPLQRLPRDPLGLGPD